MSAHDARWQDRLLPGSLHELPDGRRSARDWVVDVVVFVLAALIGAIALGTSGAHSDTMVIVDVVLGAAALGAIWWRRPHPAAVGAFSGLASIVSGVAAGAALVALFSAVVHASWRTVALLVAIATIAVTGYPLLYPSDETFGLELALGLLITAVVIGWGLFARARRQLVLSLRERAARLEAEQLLHSEQARDAERRRIAREMHDVLAHRVSLLSLHAGALEFRPDAPPEEIAKAAGVIRASAHAALQELRDVIGVLRAGADGSAPEPPQPTLADIPALVAESRAAGMHVRCELDAPGTDTLPAALGRTAYRIVQEGLTNARKHAPAAAVDVRVGGAAGARLVVEVLSRRPIGVVAAPPLPGAGSGLIGLGERVALAGGELEHGPGPAGDFVLRATLPWTA